MHYWTEKLIVIKHTCTLNLVIMVMLEKKYESYGKIYTSFKPIIAVYIYNYAKYDN